MQDFSAFIEPSLIALLSWWFGTGIILAGVVLITLFDKAKGSAPSAKRSG